MREDWRKKPRKAPEKRLAHNLSFRVTEELYEKIVSDARKSDEDIAEFLRHIVGERYRDGV